MSGSLTLEQIENDVWQLPAQEQLLLVAHISRRLIQLPLITLVGTAPELQPETLYNEADSLLALCDRAAEMWFGEFDAVDDLRRLRQDRDEQVWPSKS